MFFSLSPYTNPRKKANFISDSILLDNHLDEEEKKTC